MPSSLSEYTSAIGLSALPHRSRRVSSPRFLGLSPPPPCSEADQGAPHHQQSRGLRHHSWDGDVHRPGLAIAGDEHVGNEEIADIIRDGQLGDRRIGNSKGESRERWSGGPIAIGLLDACDPKSEIPCVTPVETPSESIQAIRDGVQRIGGGLVNDVSRATCAVELEELLVRRRRLHESISAGQRHDEIDARPVLRQRDGAKASLRPTTAGDMATGEVEGDGLGGGSCRYQYGHGKCDPCYVVEPLSKDHPLPPIRKG